MKLIEMRCPNCDAPLSVSADREEAFCKHCSTTFLIEDVPTEEPQDRAHAGEGQSRKRSKPEGAAAGMTISFERAKSENPDTKRFTGEATASRRTEPRVHPAEKARHSQPAPKAPSPVQPPAPAESVKGTVMRRVALVFAIVLFLVAAFSLMRPSGAQDQQGSESSSSHVVSSQAVSSSSSRVYSMSSSSSSASEPIEVASSSTEAEEEEPSSSASEPASTPALRDGFPCNLDSTATFSGVTIPIDSTWKDNSTDWDWRHETFSRTASGSPLEDVQVSISTFIGGDTKNPLAFMRDYADFGPIFLYSGEYEVVSEDVRDGVTYTKVEGINSDYTSLFSYNSPSKYSTIERMYTDDVVRCLCLVGYAEDGTGFAVAVSLHGSANTNDSLYSANKILDGVTFVPAECTIDSDDAWLYAVQH